MENDISFRWKLTFGIIEVALTASIAGATIYYAYTSGNELDMLRLQNRAWVVLDQLVFSNTERSGTTASIKNVGGGPAFNVGFAYECGLASPTDTESVFEEAADCIGRGRTRVLWWPSMGTHSVRASFTVGKNVDPDEARMGDRLITCFGAITYEAADGSFHETRFAMQYNKLAHDLRIDQVKQMPNGASYISSGFDASDFKAVGGTSLNWAT